MAPRHHVLLIGIDAYDGGGALTGCVNDIDAIRDILITQAGVPEERITRLAAPRGQVPAPEELPTLANLHGAFARLGQPGNVEPGDHVFIYYSGHGTQLVTASETGGRVSREALLPKDKDDGGDGRFLFDWELNRYLTAIAARTPRLTVVLDCCSSGGATRGDLADPAPNAPRDRFWPVVKLFRGGGAAPPPALLRGLATVVRGLETSQVVMACRDDERARESSLVEGQPSHGELTRALVAELGRFAPEQLPTLRWGQLWRAVEASVARVNPRQHPWIAGSFGRDVFGFGGADGDPGYAVVQVQVPAGGFRVDAGTRQGVTAGAVIGVYGPDPTVFPPISSPEDKAARLGTLTVHEAGDASSLATAAHAFAFPAGAARGRLIKPGAAARLRVRVEPQDPAVVAQLHGSPFVELVERAADVELVRRADGAWGLGDELHSPLHEAPAPALVVVPARSIAALPAVLAHYHAYLAPVRLARSCTDLPGKLNLWLLRCDRPLAAAQAQDPDLPTIEPGPGAPNVVRHDTTLCIVVENSADVPLAVTLFDCAPSGRVLLLGRKDLPKRTKHVFWADDVLGQPFKVVVPAGRTVGLERLIAIGTTDRAANLDHLVRRTGFAELLGAVRGASGTRGLADESRPPAQWTSAMTVLRVQRQDPPMGG